MRNFWYLLFLILPVIIGCAGGNTIITPEKTQNSELPLISTDSINTNYNLLGMWNLTFNESDLTYTIEPERVSSRHYNATELIPPPEISILEFNPFSRMLNVNVNLTNPFNFDAFDVRLIIYTNNAGIQLINADNWTGLYDIPGGQIINPFIAYTKDMQNRKFAADSQQTENLIIRFPQNSTSVSFAVDASALSNCTEPYQILNFSHETLNNDTGSSCTAEVAVRDWQNDVDKVYLYCPAVTGEYLVEFEQVNGELWNLVLANRTGAISQNYPGFVIAASPESDPGYLYEPVIITVTRLESHWVRTLGVVDSTDIGNSVVCDNDDNVYIAGYFNLTQDFDPGPYEDIQPGGRIFLSKYDNHLNYQWTKTWDGGVSSDLLFDKGFIYIAGQFKDTVDFDPGPGIELRTSNGDSDVFVSKFDLNGNLIWVRTWGSVNYDDICYALNADINSIYMTGSFQGSVDFDPGDGINEILSNGENDIYLSKLTQEGNYLWTETWGGSRTDVSYDVIADNSSNVYITGKFEGTVIFKPGEPSIIKTSNGMEDAYILQVDQNGDFIHVITFGGLKDEGGVALAFDSEENVYLGGIFDGTTDFNPDPNYADERTSDSEFFSRFLCKFDSEFNYQWVNTAGDLSADGIYSVTYDRTSNSIYITGASSGSPGWARLFVEKYSPNGSLIWGHFWPDHGPYDYVGHQFGYDIAIDRIGNSFTVGTFSSSYNLDFDPGPGEDKRSSSLGCLDDYFILKLGPTGYWE